MLEITKENFESEVLQSEQPVIVDFWGPACQPCLNLMPEVGKLAETYKDQVKIVKLNSAKNRRVCINNRVMGLPAFLAFKDGVEVDRISGGELKVQDIESFIKSQL